MLGSRGVFPILGLFVVSCEAAELATTPVIPHRLDSWPSIEDHERMGRFKPDPLPDPAPPWGQCLSELSRGPLLYSNPTLRIAAYASTQPYYFFIERDGMSPRTTESDLTPIVTRLRSRAVLPGATKSPGINFCSIWPTLPKPLCLGVEVQIRATTLPMLADQIGEMLKDEGTSCIGTLVTAAGWDEPRCDGSEPSCLPLPYCTPSPGRCARPPYHPEAPRSRIWEAAHLTAGSCRSDGDCVENGCGNHCTSYTNYSLPGICPYYSILEPGFCGCVQGQCWWFRQ